MRVIPDLLVLCCGEGVARDHALGSREGGTIFIPALRGLLVGKFDQREINLGLRQSVNSFAST